jgi:hypothetical protein
MAANHEPQQRPGLGVDSKGGAVIDPTANVLQLVEAAISRQDDLRDSFEKLVQAKLEHLKDVGNLRAEFSKEIRYLETERVNAVRQVDVSAVKTESERALIAIQTLAAQTATDAQAIAKQTAEDRRQLMEQIAALQKSSYEGAGKGSGLNAMWGYVAGGIGLILSILSAFGIIMSLRVK